ncbi:MAG: alpha/beta fold hydrolase, partial [Solirubrobacterales bacterium]|nr:alpha/beta fold hydrolase [Solirubrobacterales bacterium]
MLPTWPIAHSRFWKLQIPYLSRHCRVVAFDGRGGGRSDQPAGAHSYAIDEIVADVLAVMDATGTASATLVGFSCAALCATVLAADHPQRVCGVVHIGPAVALAPMHPERCG